MTRAAAQDPVESAGSLSEESKRFDHPAFGQIVASRVQGTRVLYGSDFLHRHFVTITISRSQLCRDLSHDWHFGGKELIEVHLSEAQWATFVSSMNVGSGVPCTLDHVGGDVRDAKGNWLGTAFGPSVDSLHRAGLLDRSRQASVAAPVPGHAYDQRRGSRVPRQPQRPMTARVLRISPDLSLPTDVITSTTAVFGGRTIGPNSLGAVLDWLGEHVDKTKAKELSARVRSLDVGEALVVSPGWLKTDGVVVKIRERETFDSSATPKAGQKAVRVTGPAAKPDLVAYQAKMAETIERAKDNDPKFLRGEVDRLKKENAKAQAIIDKGASAPARSGKPDPAIIQRAVDAAVGKVKRAFVSDLRAVKRTAQNIMAATAAIAESASTFHGALDEIVRDAEIRAQEAAVLEPDSLVTVRGDGQPRTIGALTDSPRPRASVFTPGNSHLDQPGAPASGIPARPRGARSMAGVGPGDPSLPDGERKVLTAIAQYEGVDREQLTVLTGYKKSSRDAYLQRLRAKGLTADNGRIIEATEEGIKALGAYEKLPEGERLREYWLSRLPEGESKILTIVCHAYPKSIQRDDIDAGYLKSSRDAYLQRLAARKLVSFPARGAVLASRNLFDL